MKERRMIRWIAVVTLLSVAAISRAGTLTVAAAVSMKDALVQVASDRKAAGKGEVEFVFGSSGQLEQQILHGAPVDLFISAGVKQMDRLQEKGAIDAATRRDVASNRLVLIAPGESNINAGSLADLDDSQVRRIAIGEPKTVPAGAYAFEALSNAGLSSLLADRIITAANVRQVLGYVERGEVNVGIVYASDAKLSGDKVKIVCEIDPALHAPIAFPAAVVARSPRAEEARAFLHDLLAEPGQARLAEFGFAVPAESRK